MSGKGFVAFWDHYFLLDAVYERDGSVFDVSLSPLPLHIKILRYFCSLL